MKFNTTLIVLVVLSTTLVLGIAKGSDQIQITTNEHDQKNPAIYKDIVVWQDNRNGNWDIYGYNLKTNEEFQITTSVHHEKYPDIHENIVVWEDNRNGDWDIYGYNLKTHEEFRITVDSANQYGPAIYKNFVVYTDERHVTNTNIYGYNLSTNEEFRITTRLYDQCSPVIHKNTVAWIEYTDDTNSIYAYTISTKEKVLITTSKRLIFHIAVFDDTVIWTDRGGYDFIYKYDMKTQKKTTIAITPDYISDLAMYGDVIVWVHEGFTKETIRGYNFTTYQQFEITGNGTKPLGGDKNAIALYQDTLIWEDDSHGNPDIYACSLSANKTITNRLAPVVPYAYQYVILTVLAITGGVFLVNMYINRIRDTVISNLELKEKEKKEFELHPVFFLMWVILFLMYTLWGFFTVYYQRDLLGFYFIIFNAFSGVFIFWIRKAPNIWITDNEIVIFKYFLRTITVIPKDTIQDIIFKRGIKNVVVITKDKKEKLKLSSLKKRDRDEVVRILSKEFL